MKALIQLLFCLSTAISVYSCSENDDRISDCDLDACNPAKKTIKEVANAEGRVLYDPNNEWWIIISSIDGTYDSQDLGVICSELSGNLQEVNLNVQFSGKYKEFCDSSQAIIPGQTYYYLHLTKIDKLTDN